MKTKSASVQNFQQLVKQMINGTRPDNDQIMEFHRLIYEKWRFEKVSESRSAVCKHGIPEELVSDEQSISAPQAHRRSRRPKYKRFSVDVEPVSCPGETAETGQTEETGETKGSKPLQVQTCPSNDNKQAHSTNSEANFAGYADKIIEIWSKSPKREGQLPRTNNKIEMAEKDPAHNSVMGSPKQKQDKEDLSFDTWKRKKTLVYKRMIKEVKAVEQQKVLQNRAHMESTKNTKQMQLHKKGQAKGTRRNPELLFKKHRDLPTRADEINKSNCNNIIKRGRDVGLRVFDTLEEQRGMEFRKKKRMSTPMMQRSRHMANVQRNKTTLMDDRIGNIAFNSWLNQLNWTLHKKYMRERRHLVRSSYCQPFYYGNTSVF